MGTLEYEDAKATYNAYLEEWWVPNEWGEPPRGFDDLSQEEQRRWYRISQAQRPWVWRRLY